ncbi:hypothetical protein AMTR_s03399p00002850 [Amborella trichopoda]|uniref:Uncharacterized protein n=1 Tax=Amborella trichopoda TaxID=13333 RepID=U5D9L0_AMBTC|nr:hypothetical protein AMTR_s03399p00002850 [Amborella trichopoda]
MVAIDRIVVRYELQGLLIFKVEILWPKDHMLADVIVDPCACSTSCKHPCWSSLLLSNGVTARIGRLYSANLAVPAEQGKQQAVIPGPATNRFAVRSATLIAACLPSVQARLIAV